MNIVEKDNRPLIRIGYWEFLDRFNKISGPLLEFFIGDDVKIFFRMIDKKHEKIDIQEDPYSLENINITVILKTGYWGNDEDKFIYTVSNGLEIISEETGYFCLNIPKIDTSKFEPGHYLMYVVFGKDGETRTVLKDFIEFLQ